MTIGINSLFSGEHGRKMIKESIAQDRAAQQGLTEMVEDPIGSSRAEPEKVSVPGGGMQDTGTEYGTSDFPTHAPNDQEHTLDAGPNTTKAPEAHTDDMVQLPTQAHKDAMSILKQQTAMLDKQTMFDDPADETVGVIAPPDTEGDMDNEDDDYATLMPGAMPYGECLERAGSILDQLAEASGGRPASRRQHFMLNVQNQGMKGSSDPVLSADPDEYGNPVTDTEKPEHYLDDADGNEYPEEYPEMRTGHSGQVKTLDGGKPPVVGAHESAAVASAVQLIAEGNNPDDVATLLLGS